jgi:protein-S-isoprenylcysteine O-methyltransferase Ste14
MMPTKKLLISGPFKYSRNPMSFGILLHYLGIAVWVGSFSLIMIVAVCAFLLMLYIKRVEEYELERRFGQEYREYKRTTPFIIPKIILKD